MAVVLAIAAAMYTRPDYNWDLAGYIGVVYAYEEHEPDVVHRRTYDTLRETLPSYRYDEFSGMNGNVYRGLVQNNAEYFRQQLPFYAIRPLYTGLLYALSKAGLNIVHAAVGIAAASYVAIALLVFLWIGRDRRGLGMLVALFLMASAPLVGIAGLTSPDALSACLSLLALYLLLDRKRPLASALVLLATILARNDNVVLAVLAFGYMATLAPAPLRWSWRRSAVFSALAVACYVAIGKLSGNYGWMVVFAHTFHGYMVAPAEFHQPFSLGFYAAGLKNGLISLRQSSLPVFLLVGAVGLIFGRDDRLTAYRSVILLAIALIALRAVLFPLFVDRLFAFYDVLFVVATFKLLDAAMRHAPAGSGARHQQQNI